MASRAITTSAPTRPANTRLTPRRREAIETEIETLLGRAEHLIARLDRYDGDPDFEETDAEDAFAFSAEALQFMISSGPGCRVSDPGGGNADDEGEAINEDGSDEISPLLPRYGVDQSLGPINDVEAYRAWQRSLSE